MEPTPYSPTRRRTLSPAVLVTVAVVAVAGLLGAGVLIGKTLSRSDEAGGPVPGQLRGTFPERPEIGWRLAADTVAPGAKFVRPDPESSQYERPGFIDVDGLLITTVLTPDGDRELVGVDAASGRPRWTAPVPAAQTGRADPRCASATVTGLLPCVVGADLWLVDIASGAVRRTLPAPDVTYAVEVHGEDVFTRGYSHASQRSFFARGTVEDLTSGWYTTYPFDSVCPGSGDSSLFSVTGAVLAGGSMENVTVASASDGHRLIDRQLRNVAIYPGQGVAGQICTTASSHQGVVIDVDGRRLHTEPQAPAAARPWLVEPSATMPYIAGDSAYRFDSHERLWTAGGTDTVLLNTILGDVVLGALGPAGDHPGNGPLAAYDLGTGEHLWSATGIDGGTNAARSYLSDGQHLLVDDRGGLTALDLATGADRWHLAVPARAAAPAGDGFATADSAEITYYPPTGGPSIAPGRHRGTDRTEPGERRLVTKCGRTPEMHPVSYRAEGGALVVTMAVTARCPGGDIVSTDRLRVRIADADGPIGEGVFDFSAEPLVLPDGDPTTVELIFGDGELWRHPSTLGDRGRDTDDDIVTRANASGTEVVDCEDEGTSGGPTSTSAAPPGSAPSRVADGGGEHCGSEDEALNALRLQVDGDRPFVQRDLADRWVAQLSSKQPGLVAPDIDGRVVTWTPCEILRQHLRLRLQYPEVRLVWSDEWRTFDLRGWWVTVAGLTFDGADAANGWCDHRAIPVDECYAKVVSSTRDSRGTTKYRS